MPLTAWQVKRLRRRVQRERCPAARNTGVMHRWHEYNGVGVLGFESGWECLYCHATR